MRMLRTLATLAVRSVARSPRRLVLTLLAMAVGLSSCLLLSAFARGMGESLTEATLKQFNGSVQIHATGYLSDPTRHHALDEWSTAFKSIKTLPEVLSVTPRVRVPAMIISERASSGITLLGVTPRSETRHSPVLTSIASGEALADGDDHEILIGRTLATKLETKVGRRVVLMTEGEGHATGEAGFLVKGIFDTVGEGLEDQFALITLPAAQELSGLGESISELEIRSNPSLAQDLAHQLKTLLPSADVQSWQELVPFLSSIHKVQTGFLFIWFIIVGITALIGLLNTLYMATLERSPEFGLLRAVGMPRRLLLIQILMESVVLTFCGVVAALVITLVTLWWLADGIDLGAYSQALGTYGLERIVYLRPQASDWWLSHLIVIGSALLGSLFPARLVARIRPLRALQRG